MTELSELEEKLEWVKSCKCERPLCAKEIAEGTHDQSKTGCPSCDFAHADYPLFRNKEVLALIDKRERLARIEELENLPWKRNDRYGINTPYVTKKWLVNRKKALSAKHSSKEDVNG